MLAFCHESTISMTKGEHVFLLPDSDFSRNNARLITTDALQQQTHGKCRRITPAETKRRDACTTAGIAPKIYHIMRIRIITP